MRSSEGSELGNHILAHSFLEERGVLLKVRGCLTSQVLTFHTAGSERLRNTSASQMAEQAWMVVRGCVNPEATQGARQTGR